MADLPYIQEAQEVKITGQDSTGTTVNYVSADSNGNLLVKDYADGPVSPGTAAAASTLIGGQYNATLPTLTTGQQSAIQLDSNGRLITNLTDRILTGTLGALNATLTLPLLADSSATLQVSGTWVGTMTVYASVDGTTYNQVLYTTGLQSAYGNPGITANGFYRIFLRGGFQSLQIVMTSYTSGTATVTMFASSGAADVGVVQLNAANLNAQVVGNVPANAADSGNGVKISGVYNATLPTLSTGYRGDIQLDSSGRAIVNVGASTAPSNLLATGTLTGTGQTVTLTLQSTASVNVDVSGSGFVGTITVTESTPSQSRTLGVFALNSSAIGMSITANGNYRVVGIPTSGTIQVQFTAYTSGTATINIYGSTAPYIVQPYSANAANVLVTSYLNDGSGNAISSTSGALNVSATGTVTANQGTANSTPWNQNVSQFGGTAISTGIGASGSGIPRVTVSNDSNILATQSGTWTVISKTEDASGNAINSQSNSLNVNTKTVRTYSAPATATVNTSSTLILAANSARKGLYLSNTSPQQISFGFDGNAANYQYGLTLFPGEKFWMDEYSYSTGAIYAITTGAATYIGIQEIT
ncbi:unnamed protein product [Sphagnum balticum]